MIHTTKNIKWIILASLLSISLSVLTFFTFINQGFIKLDSDNLQILLFADLFVLVLFFALIFYKTFKILKDKKKGIIGSETSFKYLTFFSITTLIPSVLIAIFSLFLFNVVIQKYFEKKIKSIVNNSSVVARNYVDQTRSSIKSDILLMALDVNRKSSLYYDNPKSFLGILISQRLLRRVDEVYLLDSAGNILMSNIINTSSNFFSPSDEAFVKSLDGKPV